MKEFAHKKDKEVEELNKLIEELTLKNESQAEEIEMLSVENEGLKSEMDNISVQSVSSTTSRASKYPDVICPHFKNGGKCKHCIKAWKDSEKKRKKEEKG